LTGAGLGQIYEKWPDSRFPRAKIWYNPIFHVIVAVLVLVVSSIFGVISDFCNIRSIIIAYINYSGL